MKQCKTCKELKDYSEYNERPANADGYNAHCKSCIAVKRKQDYNPETRKKWYDLNRDEQLAKGKIWRDNNKERHAEMSSIWYQRTKAANVEKYLYKYAKSRANQKGLDFNIEITDIIIPEYCPYLGYKLVIGGNGNNKCSPSLDRIDPTKGYVKGNIQVVCRLFNSMKWDSSQEELIHFCKSVLDKEGIAYVASS